MTNYLKNTLGDIIGIKNSSGAMVATYTYDAWGNVISQSGTMADINPFRYRGYYYDTESGFYYLQTRYYDPTTRLFISADNYELLPVLSQTIGQLNLYAYANNNPIMFTDESGESILALLGALIGGVISSGFEVVNQILTYGWNVSSWNWGQIGLSALGGVVAGAISSIPLGGCIGSFFFGGVGAVAGGCITGSVDSLETFAFAFVVGATANLIGYGVSNAIANAKAKAVLSLGSKAKSLAVQQLQSSQLNMGATALKGSYRNAFKNVSKQEIQKLVSNANFWLRNSVFSSITSSSFSGWY